MNETILTGIRSNDEPTLGNYIGAFLPMVRLQEQKADRFYIHMFVPDLHSFTTPINHDVLYRNTLQNVRYFAAAGVKLDNSNTRIYRQSYVPAHSELTWILQCFTYFGEMSRMTQFKDKSSGQENVSVGLFSYPVLMAADILLYGAKWVPVGDDQKQHLEVARDIALRFNNKFGEIFTVPEPWQKQLEFARLDSGVRIRSLSNPDKKMSKSVSDPKGTILLSDTPETAAKKIMSATTDSIGSIHYDWQNQPGITNLLQIAALMSGSNQADVNGRWEGASQYGELKQYVAQLVADFLKEFQSSVAAVKDTDVIAALEQSEAEARTIASKQLHVVQQAVGLRPKDR